MSDSGAKTYLFAVRYKNNPQFDRALFLYYSVMRSKILKWKICRMTYNPKGAWIDSKHPSFQGSVNENGRNCDLLNGNRVFATIQFPKPLSNMKTKELADYTEGNTYYPIELVRIDSGEFFEAFVQGMRTA